MYPTPPTTQYAGDRRQQNSSGEDSTGSNESRIDSHDRFRIGGPGRLPIWPISMGPADRLSAQMMEDLISLATAILDKHNLKHEQIFVCQRFSTGHTPTNMDNTLYIRLVPATTSATWVTALDEMLTETQRLSFQGRVEMIDQRAVGGLCSFSPTVSMQLQQAWPNIQERVINRLSAFNVDWSLVLLANRGYWEEVAVNTVLIKANLSSRDLVPSITATVEQDIDDYGLSVEIAGCGLLWGPFVSTTAAVPEPTPGWPSTQTFNSMGMSLSRTGCASTGTLGGYVKGKDPTSGKESVFGITCYHIIRTGPDGAIDPELQKTGSANVNITVQSPSSSDIEAAKHHINSLPLATSQPIGSLSDLLQATAQQKAAKVQEIQSFNPALGTVTATSGHRNTPVGSGFAAPLILQDWAAILVTNAQFSTNFIGDISLPASVWQSQSPTIQTMADIPSANISVVKRGRSTGVTAGTLGGLCPAGVRVATVPETLHHRAWVIYSTEGEPFSQDGDSGAWILASTGEVIALLIGGDKADGSALVIPIKAVLSDIEKMSNLSPGTLELV